MSTASPNIVLVSIDSLRADHCGFLGDDRGLTPTMDALAEEGVAYEHAVAPGPQTFSSMPAVFTGRPRTPTTLERYPQDSHWERRLAAIDEHLGRYALLSERLRERGYDTAGVTPNPWTSTASGFDRGFDRFLDCSGAEPGSWPRTIAEHVPGIDTDARPVELVLNMLSGSEFFAQWEALYGDIQRTRERLSEPYFLWVFILDTHFPFLPGRAHRREQSLLGAYYSAYRSSDPMRGNGGSMSDRVRRSVERSYRDTVRASDAFIDRLQSDLVADDPVLMVHADHGESFGDHGEYGHHHRRVYQENVHVPYFVHNAGVSGDVDAPTSLTTIYDTALRIARDGTFDPTPDATPYAIATSESGTNRSVSGRRYKLVEHGDDRFLFDLDRDPDELTDLSHIYPDRCRELRRQLDRFERQLSVTNRLHRATKTLASRGNV
ncbi:sulfatase [Halopenitus persicus]|uniref:sulfatase n=1 Tax=Halopenitus persicus TaxID=1048396 RepID=UPI0012FD5449|nr:sulfatase [Halopenitus persicus]